MKLKPLLILFFLLVFGSVTAQVTQPRRFEKEHRNNDEYYTIISLEHRGLALLQEKDKYSGMKRTWELTLLDTALQQKAVSEFNIDSRYPLIGYEITDDFIFLLYRTGETNKNDLLLISFNIEDGKESERFEIKPELDFKVTHFSKVGSSIALGGYVSNDPAILLYNLSDHNIKVVPGFFQKDNELVDLKVNQNQTFNVLLIDRSLKSERKFVFRTFDSTGKLLLEDIIPIEEDRALQTSISSQLIREDLAVFGSWGDKQSKQSFGFFALPIDPFSEQKIKYYQFGQLENFLNYLSEKRAARIKNHTEQNIKDNSKPSFSTYVIPYKLIESNEGYILLAEVYHPLTNTYMNSPYYNPYYGSPYGVYNPYWPGYSRGMRMYRPYNYGNNVKNSDPIKTQETVIVSFDGNGNVQWDQSLKLDDIENESLEQVGDFNIINNKVFLIYKKESELKFKVVNKLTKEVEEGSEKIKLNQPYEELRHEREKEGSLKYWTDNSFFVWGYQTIKDATRKEDKTRTVFYINKVVVQ